MRDRKFELELSVRPVVIHKEQCVRLAKEPRELLELRLEEGELSLELIAQKDALGVDVY